MLLHEMGQDVEAIDLMSKATDIRRQGLGDQHPLVALSMLNLGTTYYGTKAYDKAVPQFRQALAIFEPSLGPAHPHTRMARASLGLVLMAQKEYAESEQLLRADLDCIRKDLSEKHPEYAEG